MTFNHLFYDSKVNFNAISKRRIVLSVLLGLASAVLIYSFFYVLRETDRMFYLDFENRPIVMPENERQLSNLFFAAISVILGNSISISYLFSRPQRVFSRRNNKRSRILNDQAFLGFNFIHWFAKVWFLFGIFVSEMMGPKFIETFFWPSILVILVLYLDTWKTLSLVINKGRWKRIGLHFIIITILTCGLSQVHLIDYRSIDESAYKARPTVEVPHSQYKDELYKRRYYDNLVFKMDFNSEGQVGLFAENNEPIGFNEVGYRINEWNNELISEERPRAAPRLRANKALPIRNIKEFELKLFESGQWRLVYEVANDDELTRQFYNRQLKYGISPSLLDVFPRQPHEPPRPPFPNYYKERQFSDTIRVQISDYIVVNGHRVSLDRLTDELKPYINASHIFEYVYSDKVTYQEYINVLSAHKMAIRELKMHDCIYDYDEMLLEIHHNQFSRDEKLNAERWRLNKKFPLQITERFE